MRWDSGGLHPLPRADRSPQQTVDTMMATCRAASLLVAAIALALFPLTAEATTCGSMSASSWGRQWLGSDRPCEGFAPDELVPPSETAMPEAVALERRGLFAEAERAYQHFAESEPSHPEAARALLWAARLRHVLRLPLDLDSLTRRLWPTHRRELATLLAAWGEDAVRRGEVRSALTYARHARWTAGAHFDVVVRALGVETAARRSAGQTSKAIPIWRQLVSHWAKHRTELVPGGPVGSPSALSRCRIQRAACAVTDAHIGLGDVHAARARKMMLIAGKGPAPNRELAERAILEYQRAERHYTSARGHSVLGCEEAVIRAAEHAGRMWRDAQAMFNRLFPPVIKPMVIPLCGDPFEPSIRRACIVCISMGAKTKARPDLLARCEAELERRPPWPGFERGLAVDELRPTPRWPPTSALPQR